MSTAVRILFRRIKHFGVQNFLLGAATVSAYLHNVHTHIKPFFSDQTDANISMWGSNRLHATSQSTSEAHSFHKAQRRAQSKNRESRALFCTKGGTFIRLSEKKKKRKSGCRVLRNRWYCDVQPLCFLGFASL